MKDTTWHAEIKYALNDDEGTVAAILRKEGPHSIGMIHALAQRGDTSLRMSVAAVATAIEGLMKLGIVTTDAEMVKYEFMPYVELYIPTTGDKSPTKPR